MDRTASLFEKNYELTQPPALALLLPGRERSERVKWKGETWTRRLGKS